MEHINDLLHNREHHMMTMSPTMKVFRLPDQGGYLCYHIFVGTPFFMSNRSYISVNYEFTEADGTIVHIEST